MNTEAWQNELSTRRAAVWSTAQQHECDLLLIYGGFGHAEPFRYLTNFAPVLGDAWAIVTGAEAISCVLNFNWQLDEARQISGIQDWAGQFDPVPTVISLLSAHSPRRIGIVGLHRLPALTFNAIQAALPNTVVIDIGSDIALLRRRKSTLEINLLREACRITDEALDTIRGELRPGVTERELAARLAYLMQRTGAELSFEPTVVSGNDQPIPIRRPTSRQLQAGDSVMIDIGAAFQGYQADATRTYVLGKPNAEQEKVWAIVLQAYQAALDLIRPGVPCLELHRASSKVIEGAGYHVQHRIGHGIGLATSFEWPSLDSETQPLVAGMTLCLEPGIYAAGSGDMKLEDDVLVTDNGYELLTHSRRDLLVSL